MRGPLVFLKTASFRIRAEIESDVVAVRPLALGGLHAPELIEAGLVVGIAFEILPENQHRFTREINTTRPVSGWGVAHIVYQCQGAPRYQCGAERNQA